MLIERVPQARLVPTTPSGIVRDRVLRALRSSMDQANLVVVAAPPGSGKTTAIAHLAANETRPVIWYRLASSDADASRLLGHLFAATASAIDLRDSAGWTSADELLAGLETVEEGRVLLVLDEVELLGAAGAQLLDELVADLPPAATLMIVGRSRPELNYSLLRVRALLHEHSPDLLRFRSWEIDQLWREVHGVTLAPAEVAELERKTGGWAAGLHLFHLATAGVGATERRRVLDAMEGRRGPTWEFLKRNVVDALPVELSDFLIETIGLRRLRPAEADELRQRTDSVELLDELARRQLFVGPAGDGDGFVVHDVLRAHLAGRIVHTDGEAMLRERHHIAGRVLEGAGRLSEALDAYARAGAWDAVLRMLEARGAELSGETETMLAERVPDMVAADPWWQLAQARRLRARGRLAEAIEQYRSVEDNELTDSAVSVARHERIELAGFVTSDGPARHGWIGRLRDVLLGRELVAAGRADLDPPDRMVRGIALLLSARPGAVADLDAVVDSEAADDRIRLVAAAGACLGRWLDAEEHDAAATSLQHAATRVAEPWLNALAIAVVGAVEGDAGPVRDFARLIAAPGDPLGPGIAAGLAVIAAAAVPSAEPPAIDTGRFALVDAWSIGLLLALHHRRGSDDEELVARAVTSARRAGGGPLLEHAIARRDGSSQPPPWARFAAPTAAPPDATSAADRVPDTVEMHCFGGLRIAVGGRAADLPGLRPRARELLRMCAAFGGEPIHQDLLCAALWPTDTDQAARKKLHTAVSSVRKHLADEVGPTVTLVRQESTYALELTGDATLDVRRLCETARAWTSPAEPPDSVEEAREALRLIALELLPESGAADWIVERREAVRRAGVGLALALAEELERRSDLRAAGDACEAGLLADRHDARLWTRLTDLASRSGDVAWHAWTTARHQEAMRELDVVS